MTAHGTAKELEAMARWFDTAYLPRTAVAVRSLVGTDLRATSDWHHPVVETYRAEIEGSLNILGEPDPTYHLALLEALDGLLAAALSRPDRLFGLLFRSRSVLERVGDSHGNTRELYKSFVIDQTSPKHTYLNVCFMYLILCEGVFGPQARFLLAVRDVADDHEQPHQILDERVKPLVLGDRLTSSGLGAFTHGYHRHVRNSIAHGDFKFDPGAETMRFRDYKPDSNVLVFDETWPFERMARLFAKLDDAYLVSTSYWQVHFLPAVARLGEAPSVH